MYSYKKINGKGYVIHEATGVSLPYHSKAVRYEDEVPPYKEEFFKVWIDEYSNTKRKKVKEKATMNNDFFGIPTTSGCWTISTNCISAFDAPQPLATANPWPPTPKKACKAKQEVENTMRCETVTPKTDAAIQRDYLIERLRDAKYTVRDTLAPAFHIHEYSQPKNYKELIEWIKEGKYELDTKRTKLLDALIENDEYYGHNCFDGIKFTGRPGPDWDGYHAADKALDKAYTAAKDVIMTGDAAAGLKALQDFEAWTPTGKAN